MIGRLIKTLVVPVSVGVLLTACGGGGGGGSTGPNPSGAVVSSLNLVNENVSGDVYLSLAPSASLTELSLMGRVLNFFVSQTFADAEENELVSEDQAGNVKKVFPKSLVIKDFDVPNSQRGGRQYVALSGTYAVESDEGESFLCNLIVVSIKADQSAKCLYSLKDGESSTIPVATIRDGNFDGYLEEIDSVYFVVNRTLGGFTVYKFDGTAITEVGTGDVGKITAIKRGDMAIFGYDDSLASRTVVFGNALRGLDVTSDLIDRPLFFKGYVLYPFRPTDYGNQSVFINLNEVSTTTYVTEFSISCQTPLNSEYSATHSYGVFWISSDQGQLCEAYELVERPEPIKYRFVDLSGRWESIKVSNKTLVGIVSVSGTTRLVIDEVADGLQSLFDARTVDITNDLSALNLDTVSSIDYYSNGVSVTGTSEGSSVTLYYNTITKSLEVPEEVPIKIKDRIPIPQ